MGGMITYHDYQCSSGTVTEFTNKPSNIRKTIKCPCCGKRAKMYFGGFNNMSKWNFSSQSRGYNKDFPDPQTGMVYESYGHRQQVLRDMGAEDVSGTVHGAPAYLDNPTPPSPVDTSGIIKADSIEETQAQIDKAQIDRAASGPSVDDNLNPSTSLRDSGYELTDLPVVKLED